MDMYLTDLVGFLMDMYLEVDNGKSPMFVHRNIHIRRAPHI